MMNHSTRTTTPSVDGHEPKPVHGSKREHPLHTLQTAAGNAAVSRLVASVQRDDMDDPRLGPNAFGRPDPVDPRQAGGSAIKPDDITDAEDWIIKRESGWHPRAKNKKSSAFGLGQLLKSTRVKYLGAKADSTDPADQIRAFRAYVRDVYKTAERAKQFWMATEAKDPSLAPEGLRGRVRFWIKKKFVGY
jgi:hypothetical protein